MFLSRRAFVAGRHLTPRLRHPSLFPTGPRSVPAPHSHEEPLPRILRLTRTIHRHVSTLSPSQQLFNHVEQLHHAVLKGGKPPRIAFLRFIEGAGNAVESPPTLEEPTVALLEEVLISLCLSTFHEDHSVLRRVLRFIANLLGQGVSTYAQSFFTRLCQKGDLNTALEWLWIIGKMEEFMSIDTLPQWHQLLDLAGERRNEYLIGMCWKRMGQATAGPTTESAKIIVSALFRSSSPETLLTPPTYETMKHVINLLASCDLPYDPTTAQLIVTEYTRAGEENRAQQVEQLYTATLRKREGSLTEQQMQSKLVSATMLGRKKHATRLVREFIKLGLQPSDDILIALLGNDFTPTNLKYWRSITRFQGGPRVSTRVMEHLLNGVNGQSNEALAFYLSEVRDGIQPSSDMLHVAIQSLITTSLHKPSNAAVDEALKIYRDYTSRSITASTQEGSEGIVHDRSFTCDPPAQKSYQLLLRTLTSETHVVKRLSDAVSLIEDMQRFRVRMDRQSTTSIILILMRSSSTPSEAFRIYRLIGRPVNKEIGPVLDEEGFAAILHAFCNLKTWPHGIPSTRQYFEIVADMRKQGLHVTAKVYTIIIGQLAQLVTKVSSAESGDEVDVRQAIAKTLTRVHNHLTVNTEFTPDLPLWNQLMDAYQRAGCFAEACRVWQKLFASGMFNHTSVSIILDACAFNQAYDVAVRIYTTLLDIKYPMNIHNWNTFLECLCRLGKLDEAMKVLCLEMTGRTDGVQPTQESVRILIKFAAATNQEMEVRSRVKRFLPKLYFSMRDDVWSR